MISVYELKPKFQALLRPGVRRLATAGVTANTVTIGALALSVGAGAAITLAPDRRWPLLVLPGALFVRMAFNAIDGMLAREHGQASATGALLNEIGDWISDVAMYLPLALVPGVPAAMVALVVALALVAEAVAVRAQFETGARRNDGPMGKSDRAVAMGAIAFALGMGFAPGTWAVSALAAIALALCVTIVNRVGRAPRAHAASR